MNRQEATRECQETQNKSLQRDFESTQESLNNWYEVNLNLNPGVSVDDTSGTSISSASRVTEPAISHPLEAGGDPELFQLNNSIQRRNQYQNWLQLRVRYLRTIRKLQ